MPCSSGIRGIALSVSHTTRPPRPGEPSGREYHFVSVDEFMRLRVPPASSSKAPRCTATTTRPRESGSKNGSAPAPTSCSRSTGRARARSSCSFGHAVGIFILPPSIDALEARLHKRGQDSPQVIARRLLAAGSEIAHAPEFDFVIINEDFDTALAQLSAIVTATRLRYGSQAARHHELFAQLGIA